MSPVLVDFYNTNYTGDIFVEASFSDVCLANTRPVILRRYCRIKNTRESLPQLSGAALFQILPKN